MVGQVYGPVGRILISRSLSAAVEIVTEMSAVAKCNLELLEERTEAIAGIVGPGHWPDAVAPGTAVDPSVAAVTEGLIVPESLYPEFGLDYHVPRLCPYLKH